MKIISNCDPNSKKFPQKFAQLIEFTSNHDLIDLNRPHSSIKLLTHSQSDSLLCKYVRMQKAKITISLPN